MAESSTNGYKTPWEKEKLLVTSNFSFSRSVFKGLVMQTRKNQGLFGKGLICRNYFMLSGRISRNIGENIFQSYTGATSENTDFHVLVA